MNQDRILEIATTSGRCSIPGDRSGSIVGRRRLMELNDARAPWHCREQPADPPHPIHRA